MRRHRSVRARSAALLLGAALAACSDTPFAPGPGTTIDVSDAWRRVSPETVAMDAALLDRAAGRAAEIPEVRTLLVARRGGLVLERYFHGADRGTRNDVRSVTKSVVSTLAGIAQAEGFLPNLDTTIAAYLGAGHRLDAQDSAVTVRHLLNMTSGYQWAETITQYDRWITSAGDHVQYVLNRTQAWAPGTHWTYNSAAVHLLGVVGARATGSLTSPIPLHQPGESLC